jgi:hypothetical protein
MHGGEAEGKEGWRIGRAGGGGQGVDRKQQTVARKQKQADTRQWQGDSSQRPADSRQETENRSQQTPDKTRESSLPLHLEDLGLLLGLHEGVVVTCLSKGDDEDDDGASGGGDSNDDNDNDDDAAVVLAGLNKVVDPSRTPGACGVSAR